MITYIIVSSLMIGWIVTPNLQYLYSWIFQQQKKKDLHAR